MSGCPLVNKRPEPKPKLKPEPSPDPNRHQERDEFVRKYEVSFRLDHGDWMTLPVIFQGNSDFHTEKAPIPADPILALPLTRTPGAFAQNVRSRGPRRTPRQISQVHAAQLRKRRFPRAEVHARWSIWP